MLTIPWYNEHFGCFSTNSLNRGFRYNKLISTVYWHLVKSRFRWTSNLTVTTCINGTTEHTDDERLGETWHLSELETWALCQIGNNDGKSLNSPSYFYQREIQPGELGSLERSDFEEQQENSGKQGEEEDEMLESDSPNDDGDTPSLERELIFTSEEVPASEEVFTSTAELGTVDFSFTFLHLPYYEHSLSTRLICSDSVSFVKVLNVSAHRPHC